MAYNYKGNKVILTTGYQMVNSLNGMVHQLNIRSATGNSTVWLSADGLEPCGFLQAGEARQFLGTPPAGIYVKGTAGNILYWDVNE